MKKTAIRAVVALGIVHGAGCMRDTVGETARTTEAPMTTPRGTTPETAEPGLLSDPGDAPEEFGAVKWGRDLDGALAASKTSGKPVFLLFTEVPGCSTVRGFANGPLRHPLLVEAIEDEFIPVVVRNNVGGREKEILESFAEPAWNNPVVRFLNAERADLVPRYARGWQTAGLAASMISALRAADRPVPAYLERLHTELSADLQRTVFSMYCFWTGEVKLAGLDGVVSTRPGFANGREVVEVSWDRKRTTTERLLADAASAGAASGVLPATEREAAIAAPLFDDVTLLRGEVQYSSKDDKYQIRQRDLGWVPMTPGQATAVNRAVVTRGVAIDRILSPRQIRHARDDRRIDGAPEQSALTAPNQ